MKDDMMIKKHISKERLFSVLMLYGFLIALYGIGIGLEVSTYIVFGAIYIYHINAIFEVIMLEKGRRESKIEKINKVGVFIVFLSIVILLLVSPSWQMVIYYLLVGILFVFIKNVFVLLM